MTVLLDEQSACFVRHASHPFAMAEKIQVVAEDDINALTDEPVQRHMAV